MSTEIFIVDWLLRLFGVTLSEIPVIDEGPREERLYRSRENRVVAGVCGGIGGHFNIDPTIIRIL